MTSSRRVLNRATLARQMLLQREQLPALEAVERLVGMQGQAPLAPYVGLWTRLARFDAAELAGLLESRQVVRATMMRVTVHLASARDYNALRPLIDPVVIRGFRSSPFAKNLAGIDPNDVVDAARPLVDGTAMTRPELAAALGPRWPDHDAESLAYAATYLLPMVQVPPRGVWGTNGPPAWTLASTWLDGSSPSASSVDELVLRYLGAFGPATVADIQQWSGLTRLREVVDRLRPDLMTLRDDDGVEYVDLPDAPRPDPDQPAPVRFLPEYDNLLLSHANRSRVNPLGRRVPLPPGTGATSGTVLVDGDWSADWKASGPTLTVTPHRPLSPPEEEAVEAEALNLMSFLHPATTPSIVLAEPRRTT